MKSLKFFIPLFIITGCVRIDASVDDVCISRDFTFHSSNVSEYASGITTSVSHTFTENISDEFKDKITNEIVFNIKSPTLSLMTDDGIEFIDYFSLVVTSQEGLTLIETYEFNKIQNSLNSYVNIPDQVALNNSLKSENINFSISISGRIPQNDIHAKFKFCMNIDATATVN